MVTVEDKIYGYLDGFLWPHELRLVVERLKLEINKANEGGAEIWSRDSAEYPIQLMNFLYMSAETECKEVLPKEHIARVYLENKQ